MIEDDLIESATDIDDFSTKTDTSSPPELEMLDEIPEDTLTDEVLTVCEDMIESVPEDTEVAELPELDDEFQENWKRTPINNGEWSGERGQSTWIPDGEDTREILERYGADGIEYTENLPYFGPFSAFEYDMDEALYTDSNSHQFQACNEAMMDYFSDLSDEYAGLDCDDPLSNTEYRDAMMNVFKCNEEDLQDIQLALEIGETPYGYTWHHTETPGRMQLVPSAIHDVARHRGGQSIWGGGNQNR